MRGSHQSLSAGIVFAAAFLGVALLRLSVGQTADAQALPTATGPGTYLALGGTFSRFQSDYGQTLINGRALFVDLNPYWHYGIEAEARRSDYPRFGERQSTLLVGPRWVPRYGRFVPYGKFLIGVGQFDFPHGYGAGRYLAIAPGAGVDINLTRQIRIRAVDFEYQTWPGFSFGPLRPYGLSAGVSVQLRALSRLKLAR